MIKSKKLKKKDLEKVFLKIQKDEEQLREFFGEVIGAKTLEQSLCVLEDVRDFLELGAEFLSLSCTHLRHVLGVGFTTERAVIYELYLINLIFYSYNF